MRLKVLALAAAGVALSAMAAMAQDALKPAIVYDKGGLPMHAGAKVVYTASGPKTLIIIGLFTRPAALIIAVNMIVAIVLVHMKDLAVIGKNGGWALERLQP